MILRAELKVSTELVLLLAPVRMPPFLFRVLEVLHSLTRPLPPVSGLTSPFLAQLPWSHGSPALCLLPPPHEEPVTDDTRPMG